MIEDISLPIAFGAGLLSFLSPCVLPLVPVYLGNLGGARVYEKETKTKRLPLLLHSIVFVAGFSLVFILLGVFAGLTGLAVNPVLLAKIAGSLLVFFGVYILAAQWVPFLNFERRLTPSFASTSGYLRSLAIGAAFSLGWTACVGPILGSILALAAVRATAWQGGYLLAIYSLGLGLPFLLIGAAFDWLLPLIRGLNRYSHAVHIVSALLLIAIGLLILTGKINLVLSLGAGGF